MDDLKRMPALGAVKPRQKFFDVIHRVSPAQTAKPPALPGPAALPFPHTMQVWDKHFWGRQLSADNWRTSRVRRSAKEPLFDATKCDAQHKNAALRTAKPSAVAAKHSQPPWG
jgi:hypothetical protein